MSGPDSPEPPVAPGELLARFILSSKWFRPGDGTVRPDAFIPRPPPHLDLSMYRHIRLEPKALWQIGQAVARQRSLTLHGKADIRADRFLKHALRMVPAPPKNHVNVLGWPADKPSQKILAMELAAEATFVRSPLAEKPDI